MADIHISISLYLHDIPALITTQCLVARTKCVTVPSVCLLRRGTAPGSHGAAPALPDEP